MGVVLVPVVVVAVVAQAAARASSAGRRATGAATGAWVRGDVIDTPATLGKVPALHCELVGAGVPLMLCHSVPVLLTF